MRRMLYASPALVIVALTTAAAQDKAINHAYYPLKVGSQWSYRSGKETVVIHVDKEVPVELMRPEDKTEKAIGFLLKVREVAEKVAVLSDGVYRFSTAGKTIKPPICFLKLGAKPGDTWKVDSTTEDQKTIRGQFVAGEQTITIPLGGKQVELKTLMVASKDMKVDDEDITLQYWFAERIGMVKERVQIGKHDVTLELQEFKPAR
jgi:hypothetical protein